MLQWKALDQLATLLESGIESSKFNALGGQIEFTKKDLSTLRGQEIYIYMMELHHLYRTQFTYQGKRGFHKNYDLLPEYWYVNCNDIAYSLPRVYDYTRIFFEMLTLEKDELLFAVEFRRALRLYKFGFQAYKAVYLAPSDPKFTHEYRTFFYESYWNIKFLTDKSKLKEELAKRTVEIYKLCIIEFEKQLSTGEAEQHFTPVQELNPWYDKDFVLQYTGSADTEIPSGWKVGIKSLEKAINNGVSQASLQSEPPVQSAQPTFTSETYDKFEW